MTIAWRTVGAVRVLVGADRPYHVVKAGSEWLASTSNRRGSDRFMGIFTSEAEAKAACELDAEPKWVKS